MGFTYPPNRCGNICVCQVCPPLCVRAIEGTALSPPAPRLPVAIPTCASRNEIPVTYPKFKPLESLLEERFVQVCPSLLEYQISVPALPAPGVLETASHPCCTLRKCGTSIRATCGSLIVLRCQLLPPSVVRRTAIPGPSCWFAGPIAIQASCVFRNCPLASWLSPALTGVISFQCRPPSVVLRIELAVKAQPLWISNMRMAVSDRIKGFMVSSCNHD